MNKAILQTCIGTALILTGALILSCRSIPPQEAQSAESTEPPAQDETPPQEPPPEEELVLTFGGDLMAHNVNYSMKDYSLIYTDIRNLLHADDLSFINLETPVHSGRPYESYPTFNVQPDYVDAAIDAGFDVFSLANNHTNDQGAEGIKETAAYFASRPEVYAAGIKTEAGPLTYSLIEKNGWKVLFAAITEVLNGKNDLDLFDYIKPTEERRRRFREELSSLRKEHPCDLFILSVHTSEPEYVEEITQDRRDFYASLLESSVDIVWANHPHIAKEWELISPDEDSPPNKLVMYALGNTISGQRPRPNLRNPAASREYTGDGYLIQVRVKKRAAMAEQELEAIPPYIAGTQGLLITTYVDPQANYIIRRLNDEFIGELRKGGKNELAAYYSERSRLMQLIGEKRICR